jgi:hypothetical protein
VFRNNITIVADDQNLARDRNSATASTTRPRAAESREFCDDGRAQRASHALSRHDRAITDSSSCVLRAKAKVVRTCKKLSPNLVLPPGSWTLGKSSILHHLLQIKQTHLILKALHESFQDH